MRWISGDVQSITDMGDHWRFVIGYTRNNVVYVTKDRFGFFKWTFPKVGQYVSALVEDDENWAVDWGIER